MRFKILGALVAAPIILFSGVALAGLGGHGVEGYAGLDTISVDPDGNVCQITSAEGDPDIWVARGTKGRLLIKFDTKPRIATVTAKCNITDLVFIEGTEDGDYKEQFRCYVHLRKGGDHVFQDVDPAVDPEAITTLRLRDGKATLRCSGTYTGDTSGWPIQ